MPIDKKPQLRRAREVGTVESVAETLAAIAKFSDGSDSFSCFRGHGSINWTALPSIFRQSESIRNSEYMMVRDLVSRYPDQFINDRSMFDRLVRMQHFGLPTRLLDVTSNPLAGLYFASEEVKDEHGVLMDGALIVFRVSSEQKKYYDSDTVSCVCNLANLKQSEKEIIENTTAKTISKFMDLQPAQRLYQFIREEKPHFRPEMKREDLSRQLYVVAKHNNARIIAQNGAFLAFGLKWNVGSSFGSDIHAFSLRVPAAKKGYIAGELASIGIDGGALFPEIDRAAAQITQKYR